MEIRLEIPGAKLGWVEADQVCVERVVEGLAAEMDGVCARLRQTLSVEQVAELEAVRAVRAMFRGWGVDPSRYRPSSEALLRRVAQGKGLYRISNVVDACNLTSVESAWPFGCYDWAQLEGPIEFRLGRIGETYEGIGKQTWHLEGRPVLAGARGAFGSPISDSTRTMITDETTSVLITIYAPEETPDGALREVLERQAGRLEKFCAAQATRLGIIAP